MNTPTYKNPPVVEFILGVQFSDLSQWNSGFTGKFWDELGDDWPRISDAPPIQNAFESFESPIWRQHQKLQFSLEQEAKFRSIIKHTSGARLIQIQPTRFLLNWRKTENQKPSFKSLIEEFETNFQSFRDFVGANKLGDILPNQWELIYIDSFSKGKYWNSLDDFTDFLPGLYGKESSAVSEGLQIENRSADLVYEIKPRQGRVHVNSRIGKWGTSDEAVIVTTTARGPIHEDNLRHGLDLGHKYAIEVFHKITSHSIKEIWEKV